MPALKPLFCDCRACECQMKERISLTEVMVSIHPIQRRRCSRFASISAYNSSVSCISNVRSSVSSSMCKHTIGTSIASVTFPITVTALLNLNLYAVPECYVILNLFRSLFWMRIIPGSIFVDLTIDLNIIIAGNALPGTCRMRAALSKVLAIDRIGRKVLVALHNDALITLGQYCPIPDCFWHILFLS